MQSRGREFLLQQCSCGTKPKSLKLVLLYGIFATILIVRVVLCHIMVHTLVMAGLRVCTGTCMIMENNAVLLVKYSF